MRENLDKESDANKNLQNELNELKEKYEAELKQVPNDGNVQEQDCENQIHSKTDNFSSTALSKISPVNHHESGMENMQKSTIAVLNEENVCSSKALDKSRDVLINTLKKSHHFCNLQLNNSDARLFETGVSNIKLLPPLKASSKESFTSISSAFGIREYIPSSLDMISNDRIKYCQSNVLAKEQQRKCADNCEIFKSENATNSSQDFVVSGKSNFFDFSLNDVGNDRENREIMKDTQGTEKNYVNEIKPLDSSFTLKDTTDAKKCESCLSKPVKFHDYLLYENVKQNAQIVLENNVLGKILEEENQSYFPESPKYVNKSQLYYMNENDFESEFSANKFKGDKYKHNKTFLKQTKDTKPIIYSYFNELSEQKNSENQHELSWLDKW